MTDEPHDNLPGYAFALGPSMVNYPTYLGESIAKEWPRHRRRTMTEADLRDIIEQAAFRAMVGTVEKLRSDMCKPEDR